MDICLSRCILTLSHMLRYEHMIRGSENMGDRKKILETRTNVLYNKNKRSCISPISMRCLD